MNRIVKESLKVDLHIHSCASYFKDRNRVKNGTMEKLPILISKLEENEVNMLAITDHDNFDYDLYSKLKEEENNDNCIKKVLPGIEFSVTIQNKVLHIVTLFDDSNDDKIKLIQQKVFDVKLDKPLYDLDNSFSEEKYIGILRDIGTDTILIAHQKESLGSQSRREHDANTIGDEELEKLVFVDYFEAFEFKNKRNEIFNNYYIENQRKKLEKMNFITGSDCHDWCKYPENNNEFEFSYFKCLPSFRGAMMAVTDSNRIKIGTGSFFSANAPVDKIEISVDGINCDIELSKGINAIIGDNSIGKSLLLHKLTEYREISDKKLKKAYESYLKESKIEVGTTIQSNDIRQFDKQGNIREIFTNNQTGFKDFIKDYYPIEPNYDSEKRELINKVDGLIAYLKKKEEIELEKRKITPIIFEIYEENSTSIQITTIDLRTNKKEKEYQMLISDIKGAIDVNDGLLKNKLLNKEEKETINNYLSYLGSLKGKYEEIFDRIKNEEKKMKAINSAITDFTTELEKTKTEVQKQREVYNLRFDQLSDILCNLISLDENNNRYDANFGEIAIKPETNENGIYRFVCKAGIAKIDSDYLRDLLFSPLQSNYKKKASDLMLIEPGEFKENIKTGETIPDDIFAYYKTKVAERIDIDFKIKNSINYVNDSDAMKDLSSGANAQIYFDLLSNDVKNPGVYIIDQPEDDVSQPSIRKKLLDDFRKIASHRQIILITHNPQFIVNLDVDNIIFLGKDEKTGKICIKSGALEYKDEDIDMLGIIADNIEGGIDSLKERYKKYEKND